MHFACTSDEVGMTGLSVTLPYGDPDFMRNCPMYFPIPAGRGICKLVWQVCAPVASRIANDYEDWYEMNGAAGKACLRILTGIDLGCWKNRNENRLMECDNL